MSVKFKPTQIAMPLSANYGRWYAKMVPTATVTSRQLADAIRRHLLNSEIVHVDGLGSLRIGSCVVNPKLELN